jgi:hypothetical protein
MRYPVKGDLPCISGEHSGYLGIEVDDALILSEQTDL